MKAKELQSTDKVLKIKWADPPEPGDTCIECSSKNLKDRTDYSTPGWCLSCQDCHASWGVNYSEDRPAFAPPYYTFHHTGAATRELMELLDEPTVHQHPSE